MIPKFKTIEEVKRLCGANEPPTFSYLSSMILLCAWYHIIYRGLTNPHSSRTDYIEFKTKVDGAMASMSQSPSELGIKQRAMLNQQPSPYTSSIQMLKKLWGPAGTHVPKYTR